MSCESFSRIDERNGEKIGDPDAEVRADDSYSINVKALARRSPEHRPER
jgi:hypothetical protein